MSRRVQHKRPAPTPTRRWAGWLRRPSRRAAFTALGAVGLVLLAHPAANAASDLFQNIGPASQLPGGSLTDAYPLGRYALDHHFDAVKAGVFSGIDVSGIPPTIAWMLANITWQITAFLAHTVITLFTFAFSLDLMNGSQATGGAGALEPVSDAVHSIYQTTFGAPWLVVAILLAGLWAIYQALVRRRYTETAGSLALSVLLVVIALAFVTQPQQTIGAASRWSNEMSGAFLSLTSKGTVSNQAQAKRNAADQLFALLVYEPWSVLQFGGLEHCVKTPVNGDDPQSVAVRPLSRDSARDGRLSAQLRSTGQVQADGKACVNNEHKYATHFLRFGTGSDERNKEHDALAAGDTGQLPDADPGKKNGSYRLSAIDKPAAEAMGKNGQYQRLLLALVVFLAELGAFLLLGALSIGVILAQVLVLLLLAFAPIALVVAVFPGRGHEFFLGWLTRLATFLLRKAMYSLVLAVLLAVGAALANASSNLGWLMAFGLQAVFFWAVFLTRHQLVGQLTMATTGHRGGGEGDVTRLAALYGAAHLIKGLTRRRRTPPASQEISLMLPEGYQPPPTPPALPPASDGPPSTPPSVSPGGPASPGGAGQATPASPADSRPATAAGVDHPATAGRAVAGTGAKQEIAAPEPHPSSPSPVLQSSVGRPDPPTTPTDPATAGVAPPSTPAQQTAPGRLGSLRDPSSAVDGEDRHGGQTARRDSPLARDLHADAGRLHQHPAEPAAPPPARDAPVNVAPSPDPGTAGSAGRASVAGWGPFAPARRSRPNTVAVVPVRRLKRPDSSTSNATGPVDRPEGPRGGEGS